MPPPKFPTRSQQPTTSGLGKQFTSPLKRRDKAKTNTYVQYMGRKQEIAKLKSKIDAMKRQAEGILDSPPPAPLNENLPMPEPSASDEATTLGKDLLPGPECITITQEDQPGLLT
ncbi:hypothetical protein C0993_008549 [Termitomyces sp. T159_Od127]|nr:hypothetical protein C0993_008549 [Termitomyces sp. T159_Od127]